jgi:phosphatidylglycerol:prolipoprotein diacylglycerol transferase
MFPVLLEYGSFRMHSFGVLVALGFLAGMLWSYREARRVGIDTARVVDLSFFLLIFGVVGARLLYIAVNWESFRAIYATVAVSEGALPGLLALLRETIAFWNGGIVWYGGLLLAFAAGLVLIRRSALPLWQTADVLAPGVMLGLAVGRLGCLAAGDDYGRIVESARAAVLAGGESPWWTVTFTHPDSLVPDSLLGLPLYPTQVMMALNALGIFAVLVAMRPAKAFHGQLVWTMMALYGLGRFGIEYFRGDEARGFLFGGMLSTSQSIALASIVPAIGMLIYCARSQRVALKPGYAAGVTEYRP